MVQAAEIVGNAVSGGITNSLVQIVGNLLEEKAKVTPVEREVDTLVIYDCFNSVNNDPLPCVRSFENFLKSYSDKRGYKLIDKKDMDHRNGVTIRFPEALPEKDASSILGSEGFWVLHKNQRFLIYDGNFVMGEAVIKGFNESYSQDSRGIGLFTNLKKKGWSNFGCIPASVFYPWDKLSEEGQKDLRFDYTLLSSTNDSQ
ncbi:hypothetical protein HN422_04560 [archaeon]|nr:hypothetical protein [archaeon]